MSKSVEKQTPDLAASLFGATNAWRQFHGTPSNAGVALVHTMPPLDPLWRRNVGPIVGSSPVVDADGSIFLGTADGILCRFSSDGATLLHYPYGNPITAPVALAKDGSVFFFMQAAVPGRRLPFRTILVKAGRSLAPEWQIDIPDPFVATGAPKIWDSPDGPHVFVHVSDGASVSELLVFDAVGKLRGRTIPLKCTRPIVGGGGIGDFLDALMEAISILDVPPRPENIIDAPLPTPSPALVSSPGLHSENKVIAVIADDICRIDAFEYDGRQMRQLWQRGHQLDVRHSSPAVIAGGLLVIANESGTVLGLDVLTGNELWRYDAEEEVLATPASFIRPIFVASRGHLHAIEINGTRMYRRELQGETIASPAVSGDRVHVATTTEFASYELRSLGDDVHDTAFTGGLVSPAIAPDGAIIAVHDQHEIWCYPGPA